MKHANSGSFVSTKTLAERFYEKTIPEPMSGCLLWLGNVDEDGYGMMRDGKAEGFRGRRATHVALMVHGITVPSRTVVCHKCDNPSCVNVDHLYIGSGATNARDREARGRSVAFKPFCVRGHERTGKNVYITKRGHKSCRPCGALHARERRKRKITPPTPTVKP